ncbi:hypothetical protein MYU51_015249 [Penicillium brevicompactum]
MACPPRDAFQIGWICALPIEAAAAKEMLDENFGILDAQDPADTNAYTLGRIGKHYVVIACLPGGQYGTTSATTVANHMVRTFSKSLRIGLMVGVAGAIPSVSHDIRLGDVVISCPEGTSGGVIQYDMGKIGAGGEFHRTGSLNSPPRSLLTALNLMRAAELTDDPLYPGYILKSTERNERTRQTFRRPGENLDRLFKPEYDHPEHAPECDTCLVEWEEVRSERGNIAPKPYYGIIASGNAVIKDAKTRENLRLKTGALCFEMEAAGLMMGFPCIVIRGICDYADTHKNKQWQGYAALAAASYAKELLAYVATGLVSQEQLVINMYRELKEEVEGISLRLAQAQDQQEQHHHEEMTRNLKDQQQKCHQVFKVGNYNEQKDINPMRAEGTCEWALSSSEYLRWTASDHNELLWVSADPGCGKSVLARSIIDSHVRKPSPAVTFRSITNFSYLHLRGEEENDQIHREIDSVVRIRTREWAEAVLLPRDSQQRLEQQLLQMEHRTYLWLHLAFDDIRSTFENSLWPAEESIKMIPSSVDKAYEKILRRVPTGHMSTVKKIFQIIIAARRPLETSQLAMALGISIRPTSQTAAEAGIDPFLFDQNLRSLCGLFVFVNNSKVYFIHQTAREYLIKGLAVSHPLSCSVRGAEGLMARVCLHYLSMKEFENVEVGRYISFSNLLVYSAVYWADHVRRMGSAAELEVKDFLHHVYDTTTNMFSLWFPTFWELAISKEPVPKLTPIHLAALNGHQNVVRRLLGEGQLKPNVADIIIEHGGDVNAQGGPHGSPLLAACLEGHEKVVRILLEYGADANSGFKDHENPLTIAFVRSHEMIMQMLLEYGADVNTKIKDGTHILERVLLSKNTKMLRMLLMHGADANSRFRSNHILQTACVMKHDEMVQILLDFGADINAKDNDVEYEEFFSVLASPDVKEPYRYCWTTGLMSTVQINTLSLHWGVLMLEDMKKS